MSDLDWIIKGGTCLVGGAAVRRDLFITGGHIADTPSPKARVFDATDLLVAPGLVDLHGDGFERNISPRPGVFFDVDTALIETDRQLIANGITTAYLAMTISWEPGLRSLDQARKLIAALQRLRPHFLCDIRVQLRWEVFALEAADQVQEWLALEPAPTIAFNDHFSGILSGGREAKKLADYAARSGLTADEYRDLLDRTKARADEVPGRIAHLAEAAAAAGVPCLAHDERDAAVRQNHRAIGITICEFPLSRSAAMDASAAGEAIVLGAPNVLRGGSHIGAVDAAPAIADGLCDVLASDYYYPAQFRAVALLGQGSEQELARYWPLISETPARVISGAAPFGFEAGAPAHVVLIRADVAPMQIDGVFAKGRLAKCLHTERALAAA